VKGEELPARFVQLVLGAAELGAAAAVVAARALDLGRHRYCFAA